MNETVRFTAPAVPGDGATITIWNSITAFGRSHMLRMTKMSMLQVLFILHGTNASAASGLKPYCSTDGGTNWRLMDFKDASAVATMPVQVAALAAGANKRYAFEITDVDDFKLEYTAGATAPTTWELEVTGIFGSVAVQK